MLSGVLFFGIRQALAAHDRGGDRVAFVELVEHTVCGGTEHMVNELARVEAAGGEGAFERRQR